MSTHIAFLSGAYKNAGDFLIESRAIELLEYALPGVKISRFLRKDAAAHVDEINTCDVAVIGGGPIYMRSIDGYLPLDACMKQIHIPMMILGGGWYGINGGETYTYQYKFEPKTKDFFRKVDEDGYGLSCRDLYTYRILKKNHYQNISMTGCPAWYDLQSIDKEFQGKAWDEIRKIVISDPAKNIHYQSALKLIEYIQQKFPRAQVQFVFHRGISQDKYTSGKAGQKLIAFCEKIKAIGVEVRDISYKADGFSVYDDCDLHIGFRVHAHIYCLSKRLRSVLVEEDGRGAGVNQALGLPAIKAYNDSLQMQGDGMNKVMKRLPMYTHKYLISDIDSYLDILRDTNDQYLRNAFELQKKYLGAMVAFIKQIENKK